MNYKPIFIKGGADAVNLGDRFKVSGVAVALFGLFLGVGAFVTSRANTPVPLFVGAAVGLYCLLSIKVADQWEKAAVLRLGPDVS